MTITPAAVFDAVAANDLERVRELIAADPTLVAARDGQGLSPVTLAQYRGRDEIVDVLLAAEPELDVFEASAVGRGGRVQELVEHGAESVLAFSPDGYTALHLAAFFGHADLARLLAEQGADVSAVARNPMRVMPLHSAAATRRLEIARLLIDRGADVNASQEGGFTPLHAAAQNGDVELVRLLLAHGADPEQAAEGGRRAADFAAEAGSNDVLELLGKPGLG